MRSRRNFFASAATAAFVGSAPSASAAEGALPPAIAALPNRRSEARPIQRAERESRVERARAIMRAKRIDAIALAGGTSLDYFTGIRWGNSERLFLFVLPQRTRAFYICPAFEEDRLRERLPQAPAGPESRIFTWQEDHDPYSLSARALRDAGIATGSLGIEERVPFVFSDGIAKTGAGVQLVSATPVTAGCRSIKSPAELKLMHLANQVTLEVYKAAWKSLRPGMTNRDLTALIAAGYEQTGFEGEASCQVDAWSALPHGSIQPQTIREGGIVLIDDGCLVEGYQSDISRTFVIGKATDKMQRVFETVRKAQAAALSAARPGSPCQAVDAAARKVVDDAGFGPDYAHFTHRVGHGIGMDGHEWPYLVKGNAQPLEVNMTTSDEPGIYFKGEFGIRLEDDMYITPDGAKWFTPPSRSLEEPFEQ
ncbi:MAG: aminopeptidase P family protein [Acidobacteriia bacterium]|nr:aminopeptidase P family protein [Terriglobia bacterium]